MEFVSFKKLTRFSKGWTITEKIDGSNGQIAIVKAKDNDEDSGSEALDNFTVDGEEYLLYAGSRNRWLSLEKDNFGFASWVMRNKDEVIKLGPGRHFGEWYGSGIQRAYGLKNGDKRFALFNTALWSDPEVRPKCFEVVHKFVAEEYLENPWATAVGLMAFMKLQGSFQVPGFMNPEGLVLYHHPSGTLFKKTFDYDESGKWAEKQK